MPQMTAVLGKATATGMRQPGGSEDNSLIFIPNMPFENIRVTNRKYQTVKRVRGRNIAARIARYSML